MRPLTFKIHTFTSYMLNLGWLVIDCGTCCMNHAWSMLHRCQLDRLPHSFSMQLAFLWVYSQWEAKHQHQPIVAMSWPMPSHKLFLSRCQHAPGGLLEKLSGCCAFTCSVSAGSLCRLPASRPLVCFLLGCFLSLCPLCLAVPVARAILVRIQSFKCSLHLQISPSREALENQRVLRTHIFRPNASESC